MAPSSPRPTPAGLASNPARRSNPAPAQNVHFTVFVRLPFPREDFVDPPLLEWDSTKEKALWKVLSRAPGGKDIPWQELADRFHVSLPFLLQQSAWLYQRQFSQLQAQMRKVNNTSSTAASPITGSAVASASGGYAMRRDGSGGSAVPRVPSALSVKYRESPAPGVDASVPTTPSKATATPMSRQTSATAVGAAKQAPPSSPRPPASYRRVSNPPPPKAVVNTGVSGMRTQYEGLGLRSPVQLDNISSNSSSSSDSSDEPQNMRSQAFKRPQSLASRPSRGKFTDAYDDGDDDDEDDPAFLPFSNTAQATPVPDPGSKPREKPSQTRNQEGRLPPPSSDRAKAMKQVSTARSSASSSSSQAVVAADNATQGQGERPPGPLSPRQAAALAGRSPRREKQAGTRQESSDGTPSMGSSFSDLDGDSLSKSALEEALLNMQGGGSNTLRLVARWTGLREMGSRGNHSGNS